MTKILTYYSRLLLTTWEKYFVKLYRENCMNLLYQSYHPGPYVNVQLNYFVLIEEHVMT